MTISYDLDQLLNELPVLIDKYDRLQWYYTTYTQNATLLLRLETDEPITTGCWPSNIHSSISNNDNDITSCVDVSYKAMTSPHDDSVKYTEMEYFVPVAFSMSAIQEFISFQESVRHLHNESVELFTGVRYVKQDEIWLSPMYQRDIAVISFICLGNEFETGDPREFSMYAHGLADIAKKYGGRPHWGKVQYEDSQQLRQLYPMFDSFVDIRNQLDPDRMFVNDYLEQILGV